MAKPLQPFAYSLVRRFFDKRKEKKIFPYVVSEREIAVEVGRIVADTLEEMVADGLLKQTSNVNGIKLYAPANEDITELDPKY